MAIIIVAIVVVIVWQMKLDRLLNIEELKQSVVQIYVYDEEEQVLATGSGTIVFEDDVLITNAHVVEGNHRLEVISENDIEYVVDGIIGYNKVKDIAILKLKHNEDLKPLDVQEKISVGDNVFAIGSPLGLKNTVSNGILSGYYQDDINVYQHTAPTSPGSSGGALFDKTGKLVGITYASMQEGQNINFAIPIKEVKEEYNIVKNNQCLDTKYYKYLNNMVFKTVSGSKLIHYALNDEYDNEKFKSGIIDQSKNGNLTVSSLNNKDWWFYKGYDKVAKYIKSSIYLKSGNSTTWTVDLEGNISRPKADYYEVVVISLKDSSDEAIQKIKKYLEKTFDEDKGKMYIQNNENYIYMLKSSHYDNLDKVEEIVQSFIE